MTFTRPEELFEENNFSKTFTKVTCFWIWAKNFWQDGQTAFTCPVQQCWKVERRRENQSFLSFPHIMWNSFATSNESGRVVKLAFIISSGTFWGKSILNETVFRFSPCFDFEQKTLVRVVTPSSSASKRTFWKEKYFRTIIFFFNLSEWFSVELRTTIHVSRRKIPATFFWKISFLFWFSDFEQNSCKTFPEMLSAIFYRTDILVSRRSNWEDKCFMENSDFF